MSGEPDVKKIEAALKRAAHKALHGTRDERSGRFFVKQSAVTSKRPSRQALSGHKTVQR